MDQCETRKLRRLAAYYIVQDDKLYKRGLSLALLRCLGPKEVRYVIREVDEGVCGSHDGVWSMVAKIIR